MPLHASGDRLDLSSLPAGVYLLKVNNFTLKIAK